MRNQVLIHHTNMITTSLPLSGLKVLDLSGVLAGPLCTMMLGDLGANVIKVERLDVGDDTRHWGPPFDDRGESAYFLSINRNKRSLTADFDEAADRALLQNLVTEADVVVENFLPGTLERRGLDATAMLSRHRRLIWCSIGGYLDDPHRPGYDFAVQAESGWMSVTGAPDGVPVRTAVALVDVLTGKDAAIAILAALIGRREGSAESRHLTVTLTGSASAALVNVAQNALVSGRDAARWGNSHANLVPYQVFQTADRPLVIAVGNDRQWRALCSLVGDPSARSAAAWASNAGRVTYRGDCVGAVQAQLLLSGADFWYSGLREVGVPVGRIRSVLEALNETAASALTGVPSSVGGHVRRPPPRLGEHSVGIRANGWEEKMEPKA